LFQFVFTIVLVAFLGLHTFVSIRGKEILAKKLHNIFQSEVTIGRVTTSFPLQLIVKDLEVKNWFKVKKVLAGMGIVDILRGDYILPDLKLEGAEFSLEKRHHGERAEKVPVNLEAVSGSGIGDDFFLPQHIILKRMVISDGVFSYIDYTKGPDPVQIAVRDLNVKLENFEWPFVSSGVTSFSLSGRVPWENMKEDGRVEFEGWINFAKKDMRAKLQVKDIDGIYIYPYYSSWVNIDKTRMETARLNFTSNITSLNNDVSAPSHLELTQISFKPKEDQAKESRKEKITSAVIGILKAMNQGKIVLDFNLKTKLDNPEFGLGVIEEAVKEKISASRKDHDSAAVGLIKLPGRIIAGTLTSAADLTKSVINCTVSVGSELKKAVGASFSKECALNATNDTTSAANQTE
jgi:hypothetical protein